MAISFPLLKKNFWSSQLIQPDSYDEFDGHEAVVFIKDSETGLRGFIAIHNTNRGPAVGGTRYWNYVDDVEALRDALRLSRAMSYKCALADVPYGGGKAVLIASPDQSKNEAYLQAYAKRLDSFGCGFYTGEDVGLDEKDIRVLSKHTTCIIGRPDVGDLPARWAALSVYVSMQRALVTVFGSDSFSNRRIAIKGLGNVGLDLARLISDSGGVIIGADIDEQRVEHARDTLQKIEIVSPSEIVTVKADIFAPCALGGDLTANYATQSEVKIICGAANNQLVSEEVATKLHGRGILYVPDYVANSGGLINVVDELNPNGYSRKRVEDKVRGVGSTVEELISASKAENVSTETVAGEIARRRIEI
jgi:leucine dehydrogenase